MGDASVEKVKEEEKLMWGFALGAEKLPFSFLLAEPLRYIGFPLRAIIGCVPMHLTVRLSPGQVFHFLFWLGR